MTLEGWFVHIWDFIKTEIRKKRHNIWKRIS